MFEWTRLATFVPAAVQQRQRYFSEFVYRTLGVASAVSGSITK